MKKLIFAVTLLTVATVLLNACRKKEEKDTDITYAEENALFENTYNDMSTIADQSAKSGIITVLGKLKPEYQNTNELLITGCATVTFDTMVTPKKITIDFGTANCLCNDFRYRRGKLEVTFTGLYKDSGTIITITPQNYFVNDIQILGNKIVKNKGRNTANNLVYDITENGQIIKANSGGTAFWTSSRTREWQAGESTPLNWTDDVYKITGTANGTTSAGKTYNLTITTALIKALSCKWIQSGVLDITPQGKPTRTLDFGGGTCDNAATVTISGTTYNITLP
jgi:hypothetical protein